MLKMGSARIDITPPVGTALAGGIQPRTSEGIEDPLQVKAIVLESGGTRLACVLIDLLMLYREQGDLAVRLAAKRTGIPADHIIWAASHTHTGPYTGPMFGAEEGGIDQQWLAALPEKFAECVRLADARKVPAVVSRCRAYTQGLGENRRLRFKDGRDRNRWLLHRGEEELQCIGSAGPIDPEVGMLAFDDEQGRLIGVLYQYAMHANTNFGKCFSADYPAVVDRALKQQFGDQCETVFLPGACADINTAGKRYLEIGEALAATMGRELARRTPMRDEPMLACSKRELTVPYRDLAADQEERIRRSQWEPEAMEVFSRELEIMRAQGKTAARTLLQAWHVGEVAFASLPGELFVQWGMRIKEMSPFPWTYPVELGGDYLGYLVTHEAWQAGGYESLTCRSARPSPAGVELMVDAALQMLQELHDARQVAGTGTPTP